MQPSERNRLVIPGQNSNAPLAPTTVEAHPSWLTQELWDGLSKKTIPIESLKPEQAEEFSSFIGKLSRGEVTAPAAAPAPAGEPGPAAAAMTPPATPSPAPAAPATPATPALPADGPQSPADVPLPSKEEREKFFAKYQRMASEANTAKQTAENLRTLKQEMDQKLADLAKRPITPANPDDPLDAQSVQSQADTIALLKDQLAALTEAMAKQGGALQDFHSKSAAELQEQAAVVGLERFQYETMGSDLVPPELSLQTSVPLPMLNAELSRFAAAVGGMPNVNKYLNDPAYKAQVEAAGHKLSEGFLKNLDKFNLIYDLNEQVAAKKFPDHMAAYSHHLVTSGKLAAAIQSAKLAGANAVANGVATNNNAPPMLTPRLDGAPKAVGWTVRSAREWLAAHPEIKPGSADDQTFQEIQRLMDAKQLR